MKYSSSVQFYAEVRGMAPNRSPVFPVARTTVDVISGAIRPVTPILDRPEPELKPGWPWASRPMNRIE
jgi:hypothetical protein